MTIYFGWADFFGATMKLLASKGMECSGGSLDVGCASDFWDAYV